MASARLGRLFTAAACAQPGGDAPRGPPAVPAHLLPSTASAAAAAAPAGAAAAAALAAAGPGPEALLAAVARGDLAAALGLPPVALDGAGRAVWPVGLPALSRAFRLAALAVHPDRCAHPDAKQAFAALSDAHAELADPARRAAWLRGRRGALLDDLRASDPAAAARVAAAAEAADRAAFAGGVVAATGRMAGRVRQRREAQAARVAAAGEDGGDSSSDSGEAPTRPAAADAAERARKRARSGRPAGF